jgi:formylglycine-generating enzyme required for sulfatase activity
VLLPEGFWIGRYEITQAEFEAVMGRNPSHHPGEGRRPAEKVNWQEAVEYCRKRTEREQAARQLPLDYVFRLPTEAEWEYACRAGTSTRFSFGEDPADALAEDYAWFSSNSQSTTHPVGLLKPNPAGLHDMHGNVWEWCLDAWAGALPGGRVTNSIAAPTGTLRVAHGGSWLYDARFCRSANRDSYGVLTRCSDLGFRVVLARVAGEPATPPQP